MTIHSPKHRAPTVRPYPAFTLVELMIAIVVMLVVIAAAARIFGTVTKVAGLGEATSDVLQEASAIERQLRNDIERLSKDGFFAIRCVEVRNDVNGPLINPLLDPLAMIRADQLVFFTYGRESTQRWIGSNDQGQGFDYNSNHQAIESRVYYGHAYQLPSQELVQDGIDDVDEIVDADATALIVPWWFGSMNHWVTNFNSPGNQTVSADATQPSSLKWLLARQQVLLADDGGGFADFLNDGLDNATSGIWDRALRDSRVDIAATQFNDIRNAVTDFGANSWVNQQAQMSSAMLYPRAERYATTAREIDQMITKPVLSSGCSSFIIDWTYEEGTGFTPGFSGFFVDTDPMSGSPEHPWFGLNSDLDGDGFADHVAATYDTGVYWNVAQTINEDAIERYTNDGGGALTATSNTIEANGARVYEAFFGYNTSEPLNPDTGEPWHWQDANHGRNYTPWPSAIRVTMVLHDPASRLEQGREVQFVINLPKRAD